MKRVIAIILLLLANPTYADSFKSEGETKVFSDDLLNFFVKEKFKEGLSSVKPYWPIPEVEIDGLANQIDIQWATVRQRFGAATGMEYIKTEHIGKSFVRHYYLHKFSNHAIYWRIDYYRPKENWIVNSIIFVDQLDPLFE